MKKIFLLSAFILLFNNIKAQNWSAVPGYQVSYNDVLSVTRHQGNIWVLSKSGIYKVSGSNWQLTTPGISVGTGVGCIYSDGVDLYAGSLFNFGSYQSLVIKWDGSQWKSIGYTDNNGGTWINALYKSSSGNLYAGGFFNYIGSTSNNLSNIRFLVKFDGANWAQPYNFTDLSCAAGVYAISQIDDSIYVSGLFPEINNIWTPSTFRFKEGGAISTLDGYGFCQLATGCLLFQDQIYVSGTRQHENINVLVGLAKMTNGIWLSVTDQLRITNTKIAKIMGQMYIAGTSNGGLSGLPTNIVSYNGSLFSNEGLGISFPNGLVYPSISTIFADTIENKLYVAGNFRQQDGNVADNFAVRSFGPLPVHLSSFTATLSANKQVVLNWRDETPEDGVRFDIQMSIDGRNFRTVGQVVEQGNKKDYSFLYPNSDCGKLYFRLAFEGKYSETRSVTIPCDVNISSDAKNIYIQTKYSGTLNIINLSGQTLSTKVLTAGNNHLTLDIPTGIYIAKFINKQSNIYNQKIIIQ